MCRLHSMQGFGRAPGRVGRHVGGDDRGLELLGEVEHVVVDPELLGHPAGVVDVGRPSSTPSPTRRPRA